MTAASLEPALAALEGVFDAALEAALPNPAALIFSDLTLGYQGKRDLIFALGLLNEGENEAALIAGLMHDRLRAAPDAAVTHLAREAWYYLRTSIDAGWQFDDGEPSVTAALAYVTQVLLERTASVRPAPAPADVDPTSATERAALLRSLR